MLKPAILLLACCSALGVSGSELALRNGEQMKYHVGWGIFGHAGEIQISANDLEGKGPTRLGIRTTTSTHGFVGIFFRFQAQSNAVFDRTSGQLLRLDTSSESERKDTRESLSFNYAENTADYVNKMEPGKSRLLPLPPGRPLDLIMSLIETRTWDLKPGEARDALVIFDDEFYDLTIHATGYENVHTPMGNFRCLVLEPRMEKTEPKGMFKKGSTVKVWIAQGKQRLPVRFQVDFKFGAGVATLVDYRPPS